MINTTIMLFIIITAVAAGILLYRYFSRLFRNLAMQRRFRRGAEGEQEAEVFLKRHGYRIVERQAKRRLSMSIDGENVPFEVRADFIAEKQGNRCVVEVKTGEKAIDPASTATRRQLLEYALSYDVETVFLFDAESAVLREIGLPMVRVQYRTKTTTVLAAAACGMVVGAAILLYVQHWVS